MPNHLANGIDRPASVVDFDLSGTNNLTFPTFLLVCSFEWAMAIMDVKSIVFSETRE